MQLKITAGKGFHAIMDNGITLSVQIGPGNYAANYDEDITAFSMTPFGRSALPPSRTAEIAIWQKDGNMLELWSGDTVAGYVSVDGVFAAIPRLAALGADSTPETVVDTLHTAIRATEEG